MKKNTHKTIFIIRREKDSGHLLGVMPEYLEHNYSMACVTRDEGHSNCCLEYYLNDTEPSFITNDIEKQENIDFIEWLEDLGYNVLLKKRISAQIKERALGQLRAGGRFTKQ